MDNDTAMMAMKNIEVLSEARKILNQSLIKRFDDETRRCYDNLDRAFVDAIIAESHRLRSQE